jgi:ribosomal protein S18 acetylase RimI-like enzyme
VSHPLDRPVCAALASRQAHLAIGDFRARRYDPAYAAFADWSDEAGLCALIAPEERIVAVETEAGDVPPGFAIESRRDGVQMVASTIFGPQVDAGAVPLDEADAPAMRALAAATEPGPFFALTHRLGRFVGVKAEGRLLAMAGERMHLDGYREVSAVCTDPAARGRGLGAALTRLVARRILADGEMPFLHAYADNAAAIRLYETLGFSIRRRFVFTLLRRTP